MNTLINDIKYALRQLRKSPGFTAVAVLTLAFGIGACTVMFSLVNAVLLRSLPFREPERLAWIRTSFSLAHVVREPAHQSIRVDNFLDYRKQAESFEAMAAFYAYSDQYRYTLTGVGESQRLRGVQVSQNFLDVLGMQPFLGRNFVDKECVRNGRRAAILSHRFWLQKFGGAGDIIGRPVTIDGESVDIVGVLPPHANLDVLFSPGKNVELLLPYPLTENMGRSGGLLFAIGRLKPGTTVAQAQEELNVINARLHETKPDRVRQSGKFDACVIPLNDHIRSAFRLVFVLLSGAVLCVLLIACINLSNLLLARASTRRQEFSVRIALGASRWYLIRQAMIESMLLALCGCVLGMFIASLGIVPLSRLNVFDIPLLQTISIDTTVLLVTVALSCLAAFLCGLLPAIQLCRRQASEVLHDAGERGSTGKSVAWVRRTLVISEIALACMLLIGAGLLIRSFVNVLQVDPGFQSEHMFSWRVDTTRTFKSQAEYVDFHERLMERVSSVGGIKSVGLSDVLPLSIPRAWGIQEASGVNYRDNYFNMPHGYVRIVDQNYLQTMRIALLSGRYFDNRDTRRSQRAVIISETMARSLWPDQNPIGQSLEMNGKNTVVGVVADVAYGLEEKPQFDAYLNLHQMDDFALQQSSYLIVRAGHAGTSIVPNVRAAIKEFDPTLASNEFTSLENIIDRKVAPRRLITGILTSFSSFAFLLAAIGLYGVIAYSVSRRTQEIGIRVALGAQRFDVLKLVVGEGLCLTLVGIVIGLTAAFGVTRILQSQLFGVTACDTLTYLITVIMLSAVAILACYLPARRAAKVDPMVALRYE